MLIGSGGIGDLYMFLPALRGMKEKYINHLSHQNR